MNAREVHDLRASTIIVEEKEVRGRSVDHGRVERAVRPVRHDVPEGYGPGLELVRLRTLRAAKVGYDAVVCQACHWPMQT